jgi:hypothetical protein
MKTIAIGAIFSLFLLSVAAPALTHASGGPSASGTYRVVGDDLLTKSIEFSAQTDERGATTGQMTFSDEARISDRDPDDVDQRDDPPASFFVTATFDALTIDRNRAVINGVVRDSSNRSVIGQWVQLIVEDNGTEGDQVNWRFCAALPGGWVPFDAEDPRDEGAWWHWWATDFENRDDVGMDSPSVMPGLARSCESVSLATFSFLETRGEGQIEVRP